MKSIPKSEDPTKDPHRSGPSISKDRESGKNMRRLIKLVTSAFLNPGEQNNVFYCHYSLTFHKFTSNGMWRNTTGSMLRQAVIRNG